MAAAVLVSVVAIIGLTSANDASQFQYPKCAHGLQPLNSSEVSSFVINLDLPPGERWAEVARAKRAEVYKMHEALKNLTLDILGPRVLDFIDSAMPKLLRSLPWPFTEEMKSLANITGLPLGEVVLYNVFYEFFTLCTSIVAQDPHGEIYHARNLDFGLFLGWDSRNHTWAMTEVLRPTVVNLDFQRSEKTVFKAVTFAGYLGILTGVKPGAFSMTVNERFRLNGGFIVSESGPRWMCRRTGGRARQRSRYCAERSALPGLPVDDNVAVTVSPSDANTIADVMAAGAAGSTEEDVASESRPMHFRQSMCSTNIALILKDTDCN